MQLWMEWWRVVEQLRPACSRIRTFLWLAACLAALTVRGDLLGVTSLVRALGLKQKCYERMLGLFHSPAVNLDRLTRLWVIVVQKVQPGMLRINGRKVLVGDGLKVPKAGKKMPAVKRLHQESEGNTKPSYIMGHSCQAVAILAGTLSTTFAIPLAARIHEGVLFNNNDKRTLLDKMVLLINCLGLTDPFYFVADAYYASRKIIGGLLANGNHFVARVRKNAVAYEQPPEPGRPRPRGRPRKYGQKVPLRSMFDEPETMQEAPSPVYGEKNVTIRWRCRDLLWRPVGILVRRRDPSEPRSDAVDLYRSPPDAGRDHPNLRPALQDRAVLQTGPPYHRRLWLSLLDGHDDAPRQSSRQSAPTQEISRLSPGGAPQDRRLSLPYPARHHRTGPAAVSRFGVPAKRLVVFRLVAPHGSSRPLSLGAGHRHGPAQRAAGIPCRLS